MKIAISHLSISKSGLAFDSRNGDSYQINESASLIVSLLQQDKTIEEVSEIIATNYNLSPEQALSDVLEFQNNLFINGLTK